MKDTKDLLKKKRIEKYNLISLPTINLLPKEADHFIDCIVDESALKDYARIIKMVKPTQYIRHLGFGTGHFLYPADGFDESDYKKQWIHNLITLKAEEFRGCAPVYDSDIEEGLEGAAYKTHLMSIIAKKTANELEYASYMADTHSYNAWDPKNIESKFDGWRYIINNSQVGDTYYNSVCGAAHIKSACICESGAACAEADEAVNADFEMSGRIAEQSPNAPYDLEIKYAIMLKNMPSKYKSNAGLRNMVFLNSDLVTQDYLIALERRGLTNLSEIVIKDGVIDGTTPYHKVPIIDVPLMPTNLGSDGGTPDDYGIIGGGEYTDAMLMPKNNLIIGIQRDIKIEPERSAADQCTYYYYSLKVGVAIENVNAIVFAKCLTHKC